MQILVFDPNRRGEPTEAAPDDLPTLLDGDRPVWVDMTGPTEDDVRVMHDVFHFHPLAIEDAGNERQRPKFENYSAHQFVIYNAIEMQTDRVTFFEINVFLGDRYIVTVHPDPKDAVIDEIRRRVRLFDRRAPITVEYINYIVFDVVVDHYFPIIYRIEDEIEAIDERIFLNPEHDMLERMFDLKRMLNEVWRVCGQKQSIIGALQRETRNFEHDEKLRFYMRDVSDHIIRLTDVSANQRDNLTSLIDIYLSASSNRLNRKVNLLTGITFGVGLLTVISGFYGMNFTDRFWPPLDATWGIEAVLLLMVVALGLTLVVVRWLDRE